MITTFEHQGKTVEQAESGLTFPFSSGPLKITNVVSSDGKLRTARLSPAGADTFFSIPARVSVKGFTVSGYVTRETIEGFSTETEGDPAVWKFVAYIYGKNGSLLPHGKWSRR